MDFAKRLVQLDVDSTFIQQEAIELLAAKAGVLDQVSAITESAMRGELDFEQSLRTRVRLLKGLSESAITAVQNEITLTDGARDLVNTLDDKGHCVALVSGGFINIIAPMIESLSIKHYKANTLEIVGGVLTGELVGEIIDRAAIGDGANDLDMMALSGLSIAFNAKPIVVQAADFAINEPSLRSVVKLIGLA